LFNFGGGKSPSFREGMRAARILSVTSLSPKRVWVIRVIKNNRQVSLDVLKKYVESQGER